MNDTPPPDIPDPASPTPATPEPARPRRVITRPDTMVGARLPGTVVTRPDSGGGSRLPGTYAANYGGDPNWKRGVTMLWLLFGLAAVAEFLRALFFVWSGGKLFLPPMYEYGRIGAVALVFMLLWVGWSWPRWVLVAIDFLFGAWFIISAVAPLPTGPGAGPAYSPPAIITMPQLALGAIYVVTAAYLAFAADVIGFVRHRREEGRGWIIVPLALIVGTYALVVCNVQPLCTRLFQQWKPEAAQFATESLRAMAQNWDVAAFEQRADPEYLKVWTPDQRKQTFGTLAGLGSSDNLPATVKTVGEPQATVTRNNGGFQVSYDCEFGKVRFAHGSTTFGCIVRRTMFGRWQLENLVISEPEFDPAPAEPAPAPVAPAPTPAVPPAP